MLTKQHLHLFRVAASAKIGGGMLKSEQNELLNYVDELHAQLDVLQDDYTAQGLALKAAKAMQQAETERADANEQDAKRYRYIRTKERMMLEAEDGEARMTTTFYCAEQFDEAVDMAMECEQ